LGAYSIPSETGLLIPSVCDSYRQPPSDTKEKNEIANCFAATDWLTQIQYQTGSRTAPQQCNGLPFTAVPR
jgi:hypothetical protein